MPIPNSDERMKSPVLSPLTIRIK